MGASASLSRGQAMRMWGTCVSGPVGRPPFGAAGH